MVADNMSILMVVLISAFGGFVQWIRKPDAYRNRLECIKTISTGVFTGILVFIALKSVDMDITFRYVLAGLSSYIGGSLLDLSAQVAERTLENKLGMAASQQQQEPAVGDTDNDTVPAEESVPPADPFARLLEQAKKPGIKNNGEVDLESFQKLLEEEESKPELSSLQEDPPVEAPAPKKRGRKPSSRTRKPKADEAVTEESK